MDHISRDALGNLMEVSDDLCLSIYIPTEKAGADIQQNPVRLKNQISDAEEQLREQGRRKPEIDALLAPLRELRDDSTFWQQQSEGLAVFRAPDFWRIYRLPIAFETLTVLADRFHLKPLLPLLSQDGRYYILAISQNEIRLLEGTRFHTSGVSLENVPDSLAQALRFDDPEQRFQFHTSTGSPMGRGDRRAMFHGHDVEDQETERILRYFKMLNAGIQELLGDSNAPLVLAGVDFLLPLYKKANKYPHLVEEGIEGNPETLSAEELRAQAWQLVQPIFLEDREEAVQRYHNLAHTEQTSSDPKQVIPAAYHGRVGLLFVSLGEQRWGAYDPDRDAVSLHPEALPGDQDLLDFAAAHALLTGGEVYAMAPEEMPGDEPLAALFRY